MTTPTSDTPKMHTCQVCGYEWHHGQNGNHDCSYYQTRTIEGLERELAAAIKERDEAVKERIRLEEINDRNTASHWKEISALREEVERLRECCLNAEQVASSQANVLVNIGDTLRVRDFAGPRPMDERVIALAKAHDDLQQRFTTAETKLNDALIVGQVVQDELAAERAAHEETKRQMNQLRASLAQAEADTRRLDAFDAAIRDGEPDISVFEEDGGVIIDSPKFGGIGGNLRAAIDAAMNQKGSAE